jgi:hypothetical protein
MSAEFTAVTAMAAMLNPKDTMTRGWWVNTMQRCGRYAYHPVMVHRTNPDQYEASSVAQGRPNLSIDSRYATKRQR